MKLKFSAILPGMLVKASVTQVMKIINKILLEGSVTVMSDLGHWSCNLEVLP